MNENAKLENALKQVKLIDVRAELFKKGDYDFIVKGPDEDGDIKTHYKQRKALQILMNNTYDEFLYGGAAGGAKSWTGCCWLLFMCLIYPGTRYFVARNELGDIVDSVLVTFNKVCRAYGFSDFKYNGVKNFIQFGEKSGGSFINFIELKYKPSDPDYNDVGSTEYTAGWIEEAAEITEKGVDVISSRVGRHMNKKYGIRGKVFMTTNPRKNWTKVRFYDKDRNNTLPANQAYLQCLITENPFIEKEYVQKLRQMSEKNKALYERLFKGNWDYADNKNNLCEYEMVEKVFENDHIPEGKTYITADVARLGSDKAIIMVWRGWKVVDIQTFELSKTIEQSYAIKLFQRKYQVPKSRVIVDSDGVGGGVQDETGAVGFVNNGTPIKEDGDKMTYRNLQVQCLYHLADKVNDGAIWIACELSEKQKEEIREELDQIQSKLSDYGRLDVKSKSDIKEDIKRSPDYRDCFAPNTKVLTPSGYKRISEIKTGDLVVTPYGNRKVLQTIERDAPEKLYEVNGVKVTGNHRFFTKKGLISADALVMNDYIYTDSIINLVIWKIQRLLSTTDVNIGFQKRQNTSTKTYESMEKEAKKPYTAEYMKIISGRFLKVSTYIILMKIPLTIIQATWRQSKVLLTNLTTQKKDGRTRNIAKTVLKILKTCKKKLKSGMGLTKAGNGIGSTLKKQALDITNQPKEIVKTAMKPSLKINPMLNFVLIAATRNTTIRKKNITKIEPARFAKKPSMLERTKRLSAAHVAVLPNTDGKIDKIHTLTVDKDNCYFVEGMLVENCLLMRVYFDLKPPRRKMAISSPGW